LHIHTLNPYFYFLIAATQTNPNIEANAHVNISFNGSTKWIPDLPCSIRNATVKDAMAPNTNLISIFFNITLISLCGKYTNPLSGIQIYFNELL
jgi:hypothetical protein